MDIKILYPATYRLPYFSTLHNHSGYFFQSLSWAISKNHQGVVKLLVERGADTKKLHSDGQTAMDLAIAQDLQLVKEFWFFSKNVIFCSSKFSIYSMIIRFLKNL